MKLLIIGLDCADPKLVFGWKDELPKLKKLMESRLACDHLCTINNLCLGS